MKVLLVNTSERIGGAAIACNRLMQALEKNGVVTTMLVRDKQTDQHNVVALNQSLMLRFKFVYERLIIFLNNKFSRKNLFQVDIANVGTDITSMKAFRDADVVHLHWVNQGFLSLDDLDKIFHSGKRIVITMHDQWYFTGVCHYSGTCNKFQSECCDCEFMHGIFTDMVRKVFRKKQNILKGTDVTFVSCSRWLRDIAKTGLLTKGHDVLSIPNAINTDLFSPHDKLEARQRWNLPVDKKLMLFGSQKITDERKGFNYIVEACEIIRKNNPHLAENIGVVVLGGKAEVVETMLPFPVYPISYVSEQKLIVELYNAVDIYVTPSLQDNLPNTIVEAMSCGVPCVGFNVGGIPEMIDHQVNGYVAEYRNSEDLANGMVWTLETERYAAISCASREKALATYSEAVVAKQYKQVYDNNHNSNI
ncbi:MAG: glycosyltransferase family 4 protein [Bacteroidaceae bacterium]|nr:glycosyltransferase family 4 protein [Bacteroidaceae bacterium]